MTSNDASDDNIFSPLTESPRGDTLTAYLSQTATLTDRLDSSVHSLPHVDPDGSSDCPFAQELYDRKEQLEDQLANHVEFFHRCREILAVELDQARQALDQIAVDKGTLQMTQPIDCYSAAEIQQRDHCYGLQQDLKAIETALDKAERVLAVSRTKKYPNDPEHGTDANDPEGEVAGLISLGPFEEGLGAATDGEDRS